MRPWRTDLFSCLQSSPGGVNDIKWLNDIKPFNSPKQTFPLPPELGFVIICSRRMKYSKSTLLRKELYCLKMFKGGCKTLYKSRHKVLEAPWGINVLALTPSPPFPRRQGRFSWRRTLQKVTESSSREMWKPDLDATQISANLGFSRLSQRHLNSVRL